MTAPTDALDAADLASLAGSSVLVTGGAGFIGSRIADALVEPCDVTVLDDMTAGSPDAVPDGADLIEGDVRDTKAITRAVADADVVFHQAGLTDVGMSTRAPFESHSRNATGTMTVLEAARRADARVVFASSAAVYGQPDSLPVHETDQLTPTSPYGIAKCNADQNVRAYATLYDLPTVSLRYFNVYGPDRRADASDVVSTFVRRARAGKPLVLHGDGTQTRDFVHVDDVVQANLLAAVTDDVGRAFNVGTGTGVSIRDVADQIVRLADTDADLAVGDSRTGDITHSRADIDRARTGLGYQPTVDIDTGLAAVLGEPAAVEGSSTAD